MSKTEAKKALTPEILALISRPLVTEKTRDLLKNNQITFEVDLKATKPQIKTAIEAIYQVKVKSVNTSILKGKTKRFKGIMGVRSDIKKAIVTLEADQQIDLTVSI